MKKTLQHARRRVAIFDIDGTLFRSSLLIEITRALVKEGVFPLAAEKIYLKAYKDWFWRQGTYEKYIGAVIGAFNKHIKGVKRADFLKIAKKVVSFNQNRVYRYTRDLIGKLRGKNYYILAISQSPWEVLKDFCGKSGFDKVYGQVHEVGKDGRFTGKVAYSELIGDKAKILRRAAEKERLTLKGSIGVGDTESDIPFLKMVAKPICFNPNKKLFKYAARKGWAVIFERKDVICHLDLSSVRSTTK